MNLLPLFPDARDIENAHHNCIHGYRRPSGLDHGHVSAHSALGLEGGRFSVAQWHSDEKEFDRPARPDKSAALKAAHEAAGLKRMLDERTSLADTPDAIWHDAEDVFADIETRNAA